jgi:hypothetical protein
VQEGRHDGRGVGQLLDQGRGDGDAVGDEVLARLALLAPVGGRAEAQRTVDQLEIEPVGVAREQRPEFGRDVRKGAGQSNPAAAKLR